MKTPSHGILDLCGPWGYSPSMRRHFGRLLFAAFAVGQLQLIPAALACAREHRQPAVASHCAGAAAEVAGAAVRPAHDAAGTLCALLGPCAVPSPVITAQLADAGFAFAGGRSVPAVQSSRPDSFDTTPPAPPPEA